MSKAKKYAITGAALLGVGNAMLNLVNQLNEMENNPGQVFSWKRLLMAAGKGALAGGAGGAIVGGIKDYHNALEKPVNTDPFLFSLISQLRLDKTDRKYLLLCEKAEILTSLLRKEFANELKGEPARLGSTERGTALKSKFDIDIGFSFKPKSFRSTEEMYEAVLDFLKSQIGSYSIVDVRDQKKSVGVVFSIQRHEYKIDVVPFKLSPSKGNKSSGYLFVNRKSFFTDNSSYTKTDIAALRSSSLSETQKKIVIVLKHWKQVNNLPMSSHLLENLVLDAYAYHRSGIPKKFTKKLIMVLKHIAENLDVAVIRSIENTNNILTNISGESKKEIIDACLKAIEDYEYQPNSIIDTFRVS